MIQGLLASALQMVLAQKATDFWGYRACCGNNIQLQTVNPLQLLKSLSTLSAGLVEECVCGGTPRDTCIKTLTVLARQMTVSFFFADDCLHLQTLITDKEQPMHAVPPCGCEEQNP